MTPRTSGLSTDFMVFMENKKMVRKKGGEAQICSAQMERLVAGEQ